LWNFESFMKKPKRLSRNWSPDTKVTLSQFFCILYSNQPNPILTEIRREHFVTENSDIVRTHTYNHSQHDRIRCYVCGRSFEPDLSLWDRLIGLSVIPLGGFMLHYVHMDEETHQSKFRHQERNWSSSKFCYKERSYFMINHNYYNLNTTYWCQFQEK